MRILRALAILLIVPALTSLACLSLPWPQAEKALPFSDDFSDPNSGWDRYSDPNGSTDYQDGMYRLLVRSPEWSFWATPGLNVTDAVLEVDALMIGGEDDNFFGLICRHQDVDNFYALAISGDGYYGISKRVNGSDLTLIGDDVMMPSERINQGIVLNHLRAECVGSRLTLFINGEQVAEAQDSDLASGDVGLIAGTFGASLTDVVFDNFTATAP